MAIRIKKTVFAHIPKTGGTFITQYLSTSGLVIKDEVLELKAHINGEKLKEAIGNDSAFCFVRHPLTWYRSYWDMRQVVPDRAMTEIDEIVDLPFRDFISEIVKNKQGWLTEYFKKFTDYCWFIGKQEQLRVDFYMVMLHLKADCNKALILNSPQVNVMSYTGKPTEQTYTKELAYAIMKTEKDIIERYNYQEVPKGIIGGKE